MEGEVVVAGGAEVNTVRGGEKMGFWGHLFEGGVNINDFEIKFFGDLFLNIKIFFYAGSFTEDDIVFTGFFVVTCGFKTHLKIGCAGRDENNFGL